MADTALDVLANPYDQPVAPPPSEPETVPDIQVAQLLPNEAPAPPPVPLAPAPQAPAPQAPAPQERALVPEAPPPPPQARQAPPPPPGGLTFVERPDKEDFEDYKKARDAEKKTFQENTLTSDNRPATTPGVITDVKDIPRWHELQAIRGLFPGMTPKQQKDMDAQIVREENRLINETKAKNAKAEQDYKLKHKDELLKADAPKEDIHARQKTVELVKAERDLIEAEYKKLMGSGKPEDKDKGNYMMTTSPLGTMKAPEFSEVAGQLGTYNPITARQSVSYAIILGSPVPRDQKTGELKPGANGITGRGATGYKVVGRDGRDYIKVQMPDNVIIRMPLTTFNQMADIRDVGYLKDREFWANRRKGFEDAAKDDLLTRTTKRVVGAIQERLQ